MRLRFGGGQRRHTRRASSAPATRLGPLALVTAALALAPAANALWWPFKPKRFTSEALINAGSLGLEGVKGRVVALGDYNGDQNTDLFVALDDKRTIEVYVWNRDAFKYRLGQRLTVPHDISNIVPADFNGDGRLDILVMMLDEGPGGWWSSGGSDQTEMRVFLGSDKGLGLGDGLGYWDLAPASMRQPILYDDDTSMRASLLGFAPGTGKEGAVIQTWRNNGTYLNVWPTPLYPTDQVCEFAIPHSSAYVDLDGDCQPDLVLHCQRAGANDRALQVYLNRGDKGYVKAQMFNLPPGSRAVTFADMNRDGSLDLVFATCDKAYATSGIGTNCRINIAYNQQAPLCSTEGSRFDEQGRLGCRGWGDLCRRDEHFNFEFHEGSEYFTSFPITDVFGENAELMVTAPGTRDIPLYIRPGDFDVDGFPDLLVTVRDSKSKDIGVKILRNVGCGKAAGCVKGRKNQRGFVAGGGKGWQALDAIKDATGAAWIDLDDDGSLDIMVQRTGKQSGERVTFIQNNFYHDAFFLKAQVLNGACDHGNCQGLNDSKKYSGNGASAVAATYKFTAFDTLGRRHAQQVPQLPQTAYHALNSPHTFIGLGRMNNYVENLFVGTTINPPNNVHTLEQLIPNSQVIINPPWPGKNRDRGKRVLARSTEWRTELFLHPGDWIPWVAAAVVGTVITLGMVVVWLGEREKKEDEKERRRALHAINFQAL